MQGFLLLLVFVSSFAFADDVTLPRGLKTCLAKLASVSTPANKVVSIFEQATGVKGLRESETARLVLLESLLKSPSYLLNLQDVKGVAATKLRNFINQGASQLFYQRTIELIEQYSPPHALSYILLAKQSLLPAYMPAARNMPEGAVQENPRLTRLLVAGLEFIFEKNLHMKPVHFTRRIFAYMARNSELDQSEKYNLVTNLILEFRRQVSAFNNRLIQDHGEEALVIKPYSYFASPEVSADGTRFICGNVHCGYYFAIKEDGRFFIVHRDHTSIKFDPDTWDQHIRVREAIAPE